MVIRIVAGIMLALVWAQPSAAQDESRFDLVSAAERYCFAAFGNHARTREWAEEDGFRPIAPEEVRNLRLPGPRYLRAYTRTEGQTEIRVLTGVTRFRGFNQGDNVFRMCWVSASPSDRPTVERALARTLGVDRFRMDDAYVYAWATSPEGAKRRVSRREFMRFGFRDALAEDMEFVLTNDYRGMVAITYMVPTERMEDPEQPG